MTGRGAPDRATGRWWLYLIGCADRSVYTGIALDVSRRLREHRAGGRKAARYLRGRGPLRLLAAVQVGDRSSALRAEYRIKQLPAQRKRMLARAPDALHALAIDG